ncbi:MAG: hypothetical protein ACOY4D_03615 [Pseudomonadota bacterium]
MALKTKKPSTKRPARRGGLTPPVTKLAADTWVIPCSLLDDWDAPGSDYAPYVKHAVLDGYALTYALLGGKDDAALALSFRPEPAIKNIRLIAIADVPKGLAHVKGEWPGFDAYRTKEGETGPTGDPVVVQRTLRKTRSFFSCTLTSEFFTVEFDYDFSKYVVLRFRYVSIGDLTETRTRKQRSHRTRAEFPDPTQSPNAEINRYDAKYQTRISKDASERVEAFLRASGLKKTEMTERALAEFIERHADEFDFDLDD